MDNLKCVSISFFLPPVKKSLTNLGSLFLITTYLKHNALLGNLGLEPLIEEIISNL